MDDGSAIANELEGAVDPEYKRLMNVTEEISPDDYRMLLSFHTLSPPLSRLPHCIVSAGAESLAALLKALEARGGVFAMDPLVDEKGEPYVPENESEYEQMDHFERFRLWALPENQQYALQYCSVGIGVCYGYFTMVVDAESAPDLLREIDDAWQRKVPGTANYHFYMYQIAAELTHWIEQLGWAYIPLDDDNASSFAMFVVGPDREEWLGSTVTSLRDSGVAAFRLREGEGRFHWDGPTI